MAIRILLRRDTTSNWVSKNPTPGFGEPCVEIKTDGTLSLKIGDGETAWQSLKEISGDMDEILEITGELTDLNTSNKANLVAAINSIVTSKGEAGGIASLDSSGKLPVAQLSTHTHTYTEINDKPTTIAGYGIADAYTKTEVDSKLTSVFRYKGVKSTFSELPSSGNQVGDVWDVQDTGKNYAWSGTAWDDLGGIIDLSDYFTKNEVTAALSNKVDKATGKGLSTNDYTDLEKIKLAGIEEGAQVNTVTSVASKTGAVTLAKGDVGLGSVQNYGLATQAEAEAGNSSAKLYDSA